MLSTKLLRLFVLACVQILGIALFCKGFFPYKVYLTGYANSDDLPSSLQADMHNEPKFDRLVFIVIDALRNDFILGKDSGFDFINSQIQQGIAFPFTAKATAPTVTLPRIKALTTGTIPGFLDAILNIAESDTSSSLSNHDNWVYQFKNKGDRKIHFFGDDTWIRLFPGLFDKSDGTTSFYVSDTVEVDLNVTRHIKTDLLQNDWDAAILHYLGLDHIGHLGGPDGVLMKPKQKEMDKNIEDIYHIVAKQDADRMIHNPSAKGTLIVVCGDHGMNEKGNHGGSSIGETSAALVFLSPKFETRPSIKRTSDKSILNPKYDTVFGFPIIDQVDIVPTLATLFSFPIPKNSLGKIIVDLYKTDNAQSILCLLRLNAHQLGTLLSKSFPETSRFLDIDIISGDIQDEHSLVKNYVEANKLYQKYSNSPTHELATEAAEAYYKFIVIAQSCLSDTASNYSLNLMSLGALFISLSAIGLVYWDREIIAVNQKALDIWSFSKYFSVFAICAYSSSMFASSFIEEEHATWYYLLQTILLFSIIHSLRLTNQTFQEKLYPIGLCLAQLFFVRIAIAWGHSELSTIVLQSNLGIQWHIMAASLFLNILACVQVIRRIGKKQQNQYDIDVNQTAKIIQSTIKGAFVLILALTSALVIVYKVRAENATDVLELYGGLLNLGLVQPLDQVQLGRLIYSYGGAGLFVLIGLNWVMKISSQMIITDGEAQNEVVSDKASSVMRLLLHLSTPLFILLTAPQNAVLFSIFCIQFQLLLSWQDSLQNISPVPAWLIAIIIACYSHAAFFLTGHTNSLASVDLSNAYVGVQAYDSILIGTLTFFSNWSGSIWWAIAGWIMVAKVDINSAATYPWVDYIVTQSALFSLVLTLLSVSVTLLREHLFIWTVFSPKYLYQIAWTCLFHWVIQVVIGSIVTQVLFKWNIEIEMDEHEEVTSDDDGDLSDHGIGGEYAHQNE